VQLSPTELVNQDVGSSRSQVGISFAGQWDLDAPEATSPVDFELRFSFNARARTTVKRASAGFGFRDELAQVIAISEENRQDVSITAGTTPIGRILGTPGTEIAQLRNIDTPYNEHQRVFRRALDCPCSLLNAMRLVPAIRGLGRRVYPLGPKLYEDISMTQGLSAQEDATATTMPYSESYLGTVSRWMKQVTGVGVKFPVVPPQSVQPLSTTTFGEPSLTVEGSGTNALVQLLFELARAENGATVLMEEPEIHLHPGAQAELASVIAGEAKTSNKQVIMTTHSEHIAGRLLIGVAEGKLSPDDIAIYSFEKDEHGICSASEIEVSENGQVAGGLRSFFQTDLDEMRRYVDALRAKA